jgi:hypothetical protein
MFMIAICAKDIRVGDVIKEYDQSNPQPVLSVEHLPSTREHPFGVVQITLNGYGLTQLDAGQPVFLIYHSWPTGKTGPDMLDFVIAAAQQPGQFTRERLVELRQALDLYELGRPEATKQ